MAKTRVAISGKVKWMGRCPHCGHHEVYRRELPSDSKNSVAWNKCTCHKCGRHWDNEIELRKCQTLFRALGVQPGATDAHMKHLINMEVHAMFQAASAMPLPSMTKGIAYWMRQNMQSSTAGGGSLAQEGQDSPGTPGI